MIYDGVSQPTYTYNPYQRWAHERRVVVAAFRDAAAELDEAGERHAAQVLRRLADQKEQRK
jgi:hypothetical protein